MREKPPSANSSTNRLSAWFQPPIRSQPASIFVFDDDENVLLATTAVDADEDTEYGGPELWDDLIDQLGFRRTSDWRRSRQARQCHVERVTQQP